MLNDSDWSEDYLPAEAIIASSQERQWGSGAPGASLTAGSRPVSYSCDYYLEFVHDGKSYQQSATWLTELYDTERGEDCGAARYGKTIPVWLQESHDDTPPKVREVGDRSEKPMTIGFLFLMGVALLYWSYRLGRRTWRRWKAARMMK